jgi:glycosyltransferase involved in cell wall biosynthesis
LFVPYGTRISPATRYRVCQLIPFLEKEGILCRIYSILSEGATAQMVRSSGFNWLRKSLYYVRVVVERFFRTWKIIFIAHRFDMLFLQRTTFPLGLDRLIWMRNKNIVFDVDDPIYLPDRKEGGFIASLKRHIKKKEVVSILDKARCVVVENNYIGNFVRDYCSNVHLIVGPIDATRNFVRNECPEPRKITIGWIGTPSTVSYLDILRGVLESLAKDYSISVRLIGADGYMLDGVNIESVVWNEETEVSELHKFDIGIMPMPDNEWTRGKVGCKMLQYMANAIPTVVSRTLTTADIVEDGVNGFLASSDREWVDKLSSLITNSNIRKRIGKAGRKTVEDRFSIEVSMPKYLKIFKECCKGA